ncbi:hypothetical protein [Mangrovibrevibacter kandeliae]|uniref:hypothetical protein n=1 Tax=Mangrovibrevibacter kandeliae TaxID=2968473 RepID=UPI0021196239|nr:MULTISPECIES: hypothetical protein [unclassified Aurantimonas]MCQ8783890.1 hypothetical protein [Aurantimonas sp. CSK15Z-1]MCW4116609.1 hypothetical protein [Aurantimonas sp. MSK8Z-1]
MSRIDLDSTDRTLELLAEARTGLLRATLLFGSIAAALALVLAPVADRQSRLFAERSIVDVDPIMTGSVSHPAGGAQHYVVRRSVLQPSGQACIMLPNGRQFGSC